LNTTLNYERAGHEAEHHAGYMMILILAYVNLKGTVDKLCTLTFKAGLDGLRKLMIAVLEMVGEGFSWIRK
jgi:hypothetical protein